MQVDQITRASKAGAGFSAFFNPFRLISSATIKKSIPRLDDGYIPLMMGRFDILNSRIADPALFENVTFRNFFVYTVQDTNAMLRSYEIVRKQSEELIAEIDGELGDD